MLQKNILRYGRLTDTDPKVLILTEDFFAVTTSSVFLILIIQTFEQNISLDPVQGLQSNFIKLKIKR